MSSRENTKKPKEISLKKHLTNQLLLAVQFGIYHAIRPLIDEGADVNGFPSKENENEDVPLVRALNEICENMDLLTKREKRDFILTFRALFECGADTKYLNSYDCWIYVINCVFGPEIILLFLKYGAYYGQVEIESDTIYELSFYRAIRYNGGKRCGIGYYASVLCSVSPGLMKELLVLIYDDFPDSSDRFDGKKRYLKFAQREPCNLTVEFVFTIDYVIELF